MSNPETGNCQLFAAIKRAWARNQIGIQDRKVGERSVSALLQVAIFGLLLERVDRRTLAFFDSSTMTAEAIGAGYATERSVRACIDALVEGGQIEATLTRGRGYFIRITAVPLSSSSGQDVQYTWTTRPASSSKAGHDVQNNRTSGPDDLDTRSGSLLIGSPQEDPHSNPTEESVAPLASSPAPSSPPASPATSRSPSPATMLSVQEALLPNTQDPKTHPSPSPTKQRKPRATKPKLAPLTVEALTPEERAVHDAIVQDPTLVQICHNVPQLARDLVAVAAGRLDVVAKVKALGAWNRNNPSKAWTTAGGNRGLTSCVTKDANQSSSGYASMRPSPSAAPANGIQVPPTPVVDLSQRPDLMPQRMRSARF